MIEPATTSVSWRRCSGAPPPPAPPARPSPPGPPAPPRAAPPSGGGATPRPPPARTPRRLLDRPVACAFAGTNGPATRWRIDSIVIFEAGGVGASIDDQQGGLMNRVAIISVDGHVKAPRAAYRDYIERKYLDRSTNGSRRSTAPPTASSAAPSARTRSGIRSGGSPIWRARGGRRGPLLERPPFAGRARRLRPRPRDHRARASMAYNRWLVDFCPARRGVPVVRRWSLLHDVDQAVADIHWGEGAGPRRSSCRRCTSDRGSSSIPRSTRSGRRGGGVAVEPARRALAQLRLPAPGVLGVHGPVGRALVLLGSVAVAAHPRRRLRALPRAEARLHRDRGVVDRRSWSARHAGVDR